mmetsp:Transcript_29285/g.69037  ORF Transcript_29285/g.69037 Transcript_29285/m.69037 type:complete len:217 (+) Transcript_29285:1452-2102(+)
MIRPRMGELIAPLAESAALDNLPVHLAVVGELAFGSSGPMSMSSSRTSAAFALGLEFTGRLGMETSCNSTSSSDVSDVSSSESSCGSEPPRWTAVAAEAPLQKDSSAVCSGPPDSMTPRLAAIDTSAVPGLQMTPKTPFRAAFAVASAREATVAASHDFPAELVAPSAALASAHIASSSSSKSCLPAADCSVHSAASEIAPSAAFGLGLLDDFATD